MSIVSNVFRDKLASCPGFVGFSRVSSSARPVNSNGAAFEECIEHLAQDRPSAVDLSVDPGGLTNTRPAHVPARRICQPYQSLVRALTKWRDGESAQASPEVAQHGEL